MEVVGHRRSTHRRTLATSAMGKHQREKARAKRAVFKTTSQPAPTITHLRPSTLSAVSSSSSTSSPHHVDLLRLAFLEWLLPLKALTSPHDLWDRFMLDWSAIPSHELPVQSSRPATLFSHVRALRHSNNMGALRKEVREGRAKLTLKAAEDDGGLRPHQTLLQWYLDGAEGGKEKAPEAADTRLGSSDGEAEQVEETRQVEGSRGGASPVLAGVGREEGAKRRKRNVAVESDEGEEDIAATKRRRSGVQQPEAATPALLTSNSNIWEALADG